MNDTKKREAWLQELKMLRKELLKKENPSNFSKSSKTLQKSVPGLASKMYKNTKESAKIQVLMLAFLTFVFESLFFLISYILFR